MKNNICVFTGSRSEFGIYKILIDKLNKSKINFSLVCQGLTYLIILVKLMMKLKNTVKISKIKLKTYHEFYIIILFQKVF